jgi:ABC-2 type transport system permease protein
MKTMTPLNAVLAIAFRDLTKLFRDRTRLIASLIFPFVFVGILGTSLSSNLSADVGYNFLVFVFTGVIGQNLFQSTASGIISLIEDRQNDFSQELFVAPVSRYLIILGKILGESFVAIVQLVGIFVLAIVLQIPFGFDSFIRLLPIILVVCLFGGAFGTLVMSGLSDQRQVNQIFPFIIFPQFFLSGVFSPIKNLPSLLAFLSRISPMTYAVDLVRSIYYSGRPEYTKVVLHSPLVNLTVISVMFLAMLLVGTTLFVRNERNR